MGKRLAVIPVSINPQKQIFYEFTIYIVFILQSICQCLIIFMLLKNIVFLRWNLQAWVN